MKTVLFGIIGSTLDRGRGAKRWSRWRPTISLFQHPDLLIDRFELLHDPSFKGLAEGLTEDIRLVSPETEIRHHPFPLQDPWDFQEVYGALHDITRDYAFNPQEEDYLVHITTGTHVAQICLFLLTEARFIPGRLIQSSPGPGGKRSPEGAFDIIDLDLSRYDRLASRFEAERAQGLSVLKSGIQTQNAAFNALIEEIELVALRSKSPMLLMGPTGAGKSLLARRIFQLKASRHQLEGPLVEVNCATLRGESAMSALFGHSRGAFTGAIEARQGLIKSADGGLLFLDEIGELGLDEQAMLLRALEEKRILPVGADKELQSDFQLIAGTNKDLALEATEGRFREDLLARINLWSWNLPGLRQRPEDIPPNLTFEVDRYAEVTGDRVSFNQEAKGQFLRFAQGPEGAWPGNFRDFNAAITRMATLAPGGRISSREVTREVERLRERWGRGARAQAGGGGGRVVAVLGVEGATRLDAFDRVQLEEVLRVCHSQPSLSAAGRALFAVSRLQRKTPNDADRLRKYLGKFGIAWGDIQPK